MHDSRRVFWCECHGNDHAIIVDHDREYGEVYVSISRQHYRGFFRRLKYALAYLFKRDTSGEYPYADIVLDVESAHGLADFLKSAGPPISEVVKR